MIQILRAKLHGLHVTDCDLNYHGSITLDPEHCVVAGIYPLEFVNVWNKNNGQRISTYVIYGEPGSGCCILNGAAARTCQKGDELIITASEYIEPSFLVERSPTVIMFDAENRITERLYYHVGKSENRYSFSAVSADD
ncbi:MAG: aspartate 1-decarboxylase [Desulfovibrio sp.]|nr:aspartate 1-decarboxylase [Desulfovibrio sp.]